MDVVKIIPNASSSGQQSLLLNPVHAIEVVLFLHSGTAGMLAPTFFPTLDRVDYPNK